MHLCAVLMALGRRRIRLVAKLQMKLEAAGRKVLALDTALQNLFGDAEVAERVACIQPALASLLAGDRPEALDVLRHNVALHSEGPPGVPLAEAGMAVLRKAQKHAGRLEARRRGQHVDGKEGLVWRRAVPGLLPCVRRLLSSCLVLAGGRPSLPKATGLRSRPRLASCALAALWYTRAVSRRCRKPLKRRSSPRPSKRGSENPQYAVCGAIRRVSRKGCSRDASKREGH